MRDPFDTKRTEPKSKVSARGSFPFHRAAEAEHSAGDAYMSALSLKSAFDAMEEVPNSLMPMYKQVMKVMNLAAQTKQEALQLTMWARKASML